MYRTYLFSSPRSNGLGALKSSFCKTNIKYSPANDLYLSIYLKVGNFVIEVNYFLPLRGLRIAI
uniref:Uncharacterized protein n=2 Tax=Picea TaxID=3328 RepID=A0A124GPA1_PICGL|nr:hypothetical protein ABT39_MTgene1154 [Picea glauca]QHR91713.1 hypothetical protein Q903MT_gene5749 [Picea sitchensis]